MKRGSFPVDRCASGIDGFDDLCDGGFVRDSVNVVLGGPGAGKSTFLLQFLWNGATKMGENGLYLSFEPDVNDTFQDAANFGWDFSKLDAKGKCKFIKMSPKANIQDIKEELTKNIAKYSIKRVAIDPISVFAISIDKESDVRELIFDLAFMLKRMKVTVLISDETVDGVSETALGDGNTRTQFIKFLADGLVNLYSSGLGGVSDRALRITKMRRTDHERGPIPFEISSGGIGIVKGRK